MNLDVRRTVTLVAVAAAAVVGVGSSVPATAAAGEPLGQCSPPYTLFEAVGPQQIAVDTMPGGNGDGWVCRKVFLHGPNAGSGNLHDNDTPLFVTFP
jgi:hypothetical protein